MRRLQAIVVFLAASAVFDLAYTQLPLYDGNSATYLLHGLGRAGAGDLRADWLAATADPFPFVSEVARVASRIGVGSFYVLHALLLGCFLASMVSIARSVFGLDRARLVAFGAWLIVCFSLLGRDIVRAASGGDWGWYAQGGVAQQYLLGFVFQPSLFGVLLPASLAAFLRGKTTAACLLAAGAAYAHPSYGLAAIGLVAAYGFLRAVDRRASGEPRAWRAARGPWLLGAGLLLPLALVVLARFGPSDPDVFARAQAILVDERIPHHALPHRWLHAPGLAIQAALVLAALVVLRKHRLALLVGGLIALGASLTMLQMATGSRGLALMFPWRISTLLIPLSTAILLARFVQAWRSGWVRPLAAASCTVAVIAAFVGARSSLREWNAYQSAIEVPMLRHVREFRTPGDLYVIPVDLKRFRLDTRARTFADYKSHPYRDSDVVEWSARVALARQLERATGDERCARLTALSRDYGVTHAVVGASPLIPCPGAVEIYRDRRYAVLALVRVNE